MSIDPKKLKMMVDGPGPDAKPKRKSKAEKKPVAQAQPAAPAPHPMAGVPSSPAQGQWPGK